MNDDFLHRHIPVLGKRVHRYGLSASYGLDEAGMREGLELGANYIFWSPVKKFLRSIIKDVAMPDRELYVLAAGPILGYFAGSVRRATDPFLKSAHHAHVQRTPASFAHISRSSALHAAASDALTMSRSRPAPKRIFPSRPRRPT